MLKLEKSKFRVTSMKTKITIIITFLFCDIFFAQNITNTVGSTGLFSIRDNALTYFSLNQSNGTIDLIAQLAGNQRGSIFKGGNRFLHTYYHIGTDGRNTFLGINSGNLSFSGSGSNSSYNTGIGVQSLASLTTGSYNSAIGYLSLRDNSTGSNNNSMGYFSLLENTTGSNNSAFGFFSLSNNVLGSSNSAFGYYSLGNNSAGSSSCSFGAYSLSVANGQRNFGFGSNTLRNVSGTDLNFAFGHSSLESNIYGEDNCAFGYRSYFSGTIGSFNCSFGTFSLINTFGRNNTAFGSNALVNNTSGIGNTSVGQYSFYSSTGNFNTAIGDSAGRNITSGSNNIAIGYFAQVPTGTASNQIRLGNTAITYAGIQVAWSVTSDRRLKENIYTISLGLEFISKLNPVSYTRNNDESNKTEYGLTAQEVEEILKSEGIENSGIITVSDEGMYELRYNDLLAPMIKAIQELNEKYLNEEIEITNLKEDNINMNTNLSEIETNFQKINDIKEKLLLVENVLNEVKQPQSEIKLGEK
jgi:hypothetical protein